MSREVGGARVLTIAEGLAILHTQEDKKEGRSCREGKKEEGNREEETEGGSQGKESQRNRRERLRKEKKRRLKTE